MYAKCIISHYHVFPVSLKTWHRLFQEWRLFAASQRTDIVEKNLFDNLEKGCDAEKVLKIINKNCIKIMRV